VAVDAAKLDVPATASLKLKDPSKFRYIGKNDTTLTDGPVIVNGKSQFGIDTRLAGMLYAVVARPPVLGGKLKGFDAAEAMKVRGVVKVFAVDSTPPPSEFMPVGGVCVVAKDTWAAIQGRKALKLEWDDGGHAGYDSQAYRLELEAAVRKTGGKVVRNDGDAYAALASAARKFEADYYVPHYAHATMECPAATARIVNGACEIWAPSQSPQAARDRVAKALNLPAEKVTVNVTLLGGGFGRKSKADFVVEAALASKAMNGQPVKLTWTREDDLHNDYFHAVSAQHLEAGIDANGKIVAWLHRAAEPTIASIFAPDQKHLAEFELGLGLTGMPYQIPNVRIENPEAVAHTRIGWLRAVNNIQHAFAAQSFIAEVAHAAGKDHRAYLLDLLGPDRLIDPRKIEPWNHGESPERYPINTGRLRKVIERATQEAGWGRKLPSGQGLGLAAHYSFVSYMAAVVEVTVGAKGELVVPRVDIAVDCGPQINPDRIRSQLEGACVMGLSQAVVSEITFKNGRAEQDNFHQYEIVRMNMAPKKIVVHFIPSESYDAPLGGVGEPAVPVIAPALMNAIFGATGKRIRRLPLKDQLSSPV
jgi:isoquinoline 1-oxidoreductase beta subunit